MSKTKFGDWRDDAGPRLTELFMYHLRAAWPAIVAAKEAGDLELAERLIRTALEKATPLVVDIAGTKLLEALDAGWTPGDGGASGGSSVN